MKRLSVILLLLLAVTVPSAAFARGGRGGTVTAASPLSLPLATPQNLTFQFLGSFYVPFSNSGPSYGMGSLSVDGNRLYFSSTQYDPYDSYKYTANPSGVTFITLPTLTGTPDYTGGNGSAAVPNAMASFAGSVIPPAPYTLTAAPVSGATTATFSSPPPAGIAGDAGWYVQFMSNCNNGNNYNITSELVSAWDSSTDTMTFNNALPTGTYSQDVCVYQWSPAAIFGSADGYMITGTLQHDGKLYATGATYYDGNCNAQLGFIASGSPNIIPSSWGAVNTVAGEVPEFTRGVAGVLELVPSAWRTVLGATAVTASGPPGGPAGLGIDSCYLSQGYMLSLFNLNDVRQSGNAISINQPIYYPYDTAAPTESLANRSLSGPFPLTGKPGVFTLASAPTAGATSVTFSTTFPNNYVNGFEDSTSLIASGDTDASVTVSAPTDTNGWPVSWPANFWVGSYLLSSPGNCPITSSTAVTAGSTAPMTLGIDCISTPNSGVSYTITDYENTTNYQLCFSDGECRIATISGTTSGTLETCPGNGPCIATPLTCSSGCTGLVTVASTGDNYYTEYNGAIGTAFIAPGTRSLVYIGAQAYGPHGPRPTSNECNSGASSSADFPVRPDVGYYGRIQVTAYDMRGVVAQEKGYSPTYTLTPYTWWTFPDSDELTEANGCLHPPGFGWMAYDPKTNILYAAASLGSNYEIMEWLVH